MRDTEYYFIFMELQKGVYKVMKDRWNLFNGNLVTDEDVIEMFNKYKGRVKILDSKSLQKMYGTEGDK